MKNDEGFMFPKSERWPATYGQVVLVEHPKDLPTTTVMACLGERGQINPSDWREAAHLPASETSAISCTAFVAHTLSQHPDWENYDGGPEDLDKARSVLESAGDLCCASGIPHACSPAILWLKHLATISKITPIELTVTDGQAIADWWPKYLHEFRMATPHTGEALQIIRENPQSLLCRIPYEDGLPLTPPQVPFTLKAYRLWAVDDMTHDTLCAAAPRRVVRPEMFDAPWPDLLRLLLKIQHVTQIPPTSTSSGKEHLHWIQWLSPEQWDELLKACPKARRGGKTAGQKTKDEIVAAKALERLKALGFKDNDLKNERGEVLRPLKIYDKIRGYTRSDRRSVRKRA